MPQHECVCLPSQDVPREKIPFANLIRYKAPFVHSAQIKVKGKLIRHRINLKSAVGEPQNVTKDAKPRRLKGTFLACTSPAG
jgi:hypothetical protein